MWCHILLTANTQQIKASDADHSRQLQVQLGAKLALASNVIISLLVKSGVEGDVANILL